MELLGATARRIPQAVAMFGGYSPGSPGGVHGGREAGSQPVVTAGHPGTYKEALSGVVQEHRPKDGSGRDWEGGHIRVRECTSYGGTRYGKAPQGTEEMRPIWLGKVVPSGVS